MVMPRYWQKPMTIIFSHGVFASKGQVMSVANQLILSPNQARRMQARSEMSARLGVGGIMYLARSPFVRSARMTETEKGYSAVDLVNVLTDTESEPRKLWADTKKRILRDDPDMSDEIGHISVPLWDDKSGRVRATDGLTWHGVKILIFELHSGLSNRLRHEYLRERESYPEEYRNQIMAELEQEMGWAGTAIRLRMLEAYADGDYDNPKQPPGCY
jgi:hypothetical protein